MGHWPAPDEGLVVLCNGADGDGVDAVDMEGGDFAFDFSADLAFDDFGSAAFDAEHGGHGWAVDVAVHEADFGAAAVESDGQVGGDGGLAHAALAGADGDDVLDLRE